MGVPKFFAYLMKKFKKEKFISQSIDEDIDWFLIDTNCLIHPVCFKILAEEQKKENINFESLENKMINAVIEYIDKLITFAKPKKGIYIAIDGPVAASKMKQQRQRRFRSVHDAEYFNKIKAKYNKDILYYWSNSAISPGTKFMDKLHKKILEWCSIKTIKIIYSSANTCGEGEHKLLQFIKDNMNYSYLTYGLDADLIFLMLVTGKDNIYLLREANQMDNKESKEKLNYISIKIMRNCITSLFSIENVQMDKTRIINDFIFLCYLLGNDFLPHLQSLDISKNGIDYLVKSYLTIFQTYYDYLVQPDFKINYIFLTNFLLKLGKEEESILTENLNIKHNARCFSSDPYEKELFRIEYIKFKVEDPIGLGVDSNYRYNYYKHYFDVDNDEAFIEKMVKEYLIGLKWVTLYYFDKIPDWTWFYPYDYPPLLCDIAKYTIDINFIDFTLGKPLTPFEQLLVILPPQSNFLLPKGLRKITKNPKSSIGYLYPLGFKIDFLYKSRYYEGIPLLPQMNVKAITHIYKKYKDEIAEKDLERNKVLKEFIFN